MNSQASKYITGVCTGKINAPKYVRMQCREIKAIVDGKNSRYTVNRKKVFFIESILKLMVMPKGLNVGKSIYESLLGWQWFFILSTLCIVHRDNMEKRRYERVVLEIARKNGKTFMIAVMFILLFFTEPRFSKFFSVAPDGALSRELKSAIEEIIAASAALNGTYKGRSKFKILRDYIHCALTDNRYIPLNYSSSRLDGKLPNVYLVDEAGALPNSYAIEAMSSGQLTILNKLGYIISTKYPKTNNPFEDEVTYAMRVLNKTVDDETIFSLLYEPDNKQDWSTDDGILEQANPLAQQISSIMDDLKHKRDMAIEMESKRENFITKHCNIIYSGMNSESYINIADLKEGAVSSIDWTDRVVYIGVDLAMSNDNCSVAMVAWDEEKNALLHHAMTFIPEERIEEKSRMERVPYLDYIKNGTCIACGNRVVDYAVIEEYVMKLQNNYGVEIHSLGFDRYNAISSAQKWEANDITCVEIKQHSSVLHPATKYLAELITEGCFLYDEKNRLTEVNFENARCQFDTNLNRYVNKKKSNGKIDIVAATIDAVYLLLQDRQENSYMDFVVQM